MADLIIKPSSSNDSLKFQGSDGSAQFTIAGTTGSLGSGIAFPSGHIIQTQYNSIDVENNIIVNNTTVYGTLDLEFNRIKIIF